LPERFDLKALVINTARMGDLIQSTPLFQGLHCQGYQVTLLYSDGFHEIAKLLAGVDQLLPFPFGGVVRPLTGHHSPLSESYRLLKRIAQQLQSDRFDLVVNATHSLYSAYLTRLANGRRTSGLSLDSRGRRKVCGDWAHYYLTSQSCREQNRFNLVDVHRMMGGGSSGVPVALNIPASATDSAADLLGEDDGTLWVGIVPGASTPEKTLPAEVFGLTANLLARRLPVKTVLLGASGESGLAAAICASVPGSLDLTGRTDPATLAAVLKRCRAVITNDTGPMHIAAAVGTPVVDVSLGSALGNETAPYGEGHIVLEARIGCHPCLPRLRCTHHSCGRQIPADLIAEAAHSQITGTPFIPATDRSWGETNIYRTEFDRDGFLTLRSLNADAMTISDIVAEGLKQVWIRSLEGSCAASGGSPKSDIPEDNPQVLTLLIEEIGKLVQIAHVGAVSSVELAQIAEDPRRIETIKALAKALDEVDRGLAQLAFARPEIMPLVAQFTSLKQSEYFDGLKPLAGYNAHCFSRLEDWARAFRLAITKLTDPLGEVDVEAA
jgi:ADP-heptose:LPS heptosyltransferase